MKKTALVLLILPMMTACTTVQPKTAATSVPDVSGVDVPVSLLTRHSYVPPKDASNDAFFAAHSENKGVAKLQDFQMGLITEMMILSHESGQKITIHKGKSDAR